MVFCTKGSLFFKMKSFARKKSPVIILISIFLALLPVFLLSSRVDLAVILSLLIVSGLLGVSLVMYAAEDNILTISVVVFFTLFFIIAPVIQLNSSSVNLVNTMPPDTNSIVFANLYTAVFIGAFMWFERFFSSKIRIKPVKVSQGEFKLGSFIFSIIISVAVAYFAFKDAVNLNINFLNDLLLSEQLIKSKVIYMIPFVTLALLLQSGYKRNLLLVFIAVMCLLLTKNFFLERRNALGPIYLSLLVIVFPVLISKGSNFFYFISTVMFVGFPLSSVFTHAVNKLDVRVGIDDFVNVVQDHFLQLHYDAWANLVAVIQMVDKTSFMLGKQLVGSLLFFVPRSAWEAKPLPTGLLIGDYLSAYYLMWFNNLSAPIVAEGYVDFGLFGVLFFAMGLSFVVVKLYKLFQADNRRHLIFYLYFSFFLFFILRGSLMSGYAYLVGAFLAIYLWPLVLYRVNYLFKK